MGKIRILPENIVSKIAAGEIVERPASVVKELLENSLDAQSTQIQIELRVGGKKFVSVIDNGEGMTRDDALLSLERHTTSKIRGAEDLFSIKTLGFRGEALPSIAGVSRFKLTTKTKDALAGTRISIEGGVIKNVVEIGCPPGTTVEVKDLFYNTPPRLKFMKTTETELSNILDIIQREALPRPDIGFEVTHEGRTLLRLTQRKALEERLPEIFPDTNLFEIKSESEGIKVHGFVSSSEDTRTTTQKLFTYVNRRSVKDKFLIRMLIDSYGKLIERGKFPQGILLIEIPSEEVDVNVHPTKNEVRFRRSGLVGSLIKVSISDMLSNAPWIKDYRTRVEKSVRGFLEECKIPEEPLRISKDRFFGTREVVQIADRSLLTKSNTEPLSKFSDQEISRVGEENSLLKTVDVPISQIDEIKPSHLSVIQDSQETPRSDLFKQEGFFSKLNVIGQLGELYIICASERGMILIDQHAAHERINYEKLKNAYLKKGFETQELLFPISIELSSDETQILEEHKAEIESLGINIEEFGKGSFLIRSIPALLKNSDVENLLKEVVGEIAALGKEESLTERIDHIIATMACHSSLCASHELHLEKMKALLQELDCTKFPYACPHGRPVTRELTFEELEKMFKRA
jgi:DNA mismatch repair protein MutL